MGTIGLALLTALAPALAPAPAEVLQPSSGWSIDYADTSCTLSRSFGTGEDAVSLGLMPQTGGDRVRLVLIARNRDLFDGQGQAEIRAATGDPLATSAFSSAIHPQQGRVAMMRVGRDTLTGLAGSATVTLTLDGKPITLAIPAMSAALKGLAACETDLAKEWGVDLPIVATPAVPLLPQKWLTDDDYPAEAMRRSQSGDVGFRLSVDAGGKTTACNITYSSGTPLLDQTVCSVMMKRSRFKPALDKDGKPVASIWASTFLWTLPNSRR